MQQSPLRASFVEVPDTTGHYKACTPFPLSRNLGSPSHTHSLPRSSHLHGSRAVDPLPSDEPVRLRGTVLIPILGDRGSRRTKKPGYRAPASERSLLQPGADPF